MSGLLALCGLALPVQHVAEFGTNFAGNHLIAGALLFTAVVIVWFLPSHMGTEEAPAHDTSTWYLHYA
jgi:hypothetical protein